MGRNLTTRAKVSLAIIFLCMPALLAGCGGGGGGQSPSQVHIAALPQDVVAAATPGSNGQTSFAANGATLDDLQLGTLISAHPTDAAVTVPEGSDQAAYYVVATDLPPATSQVGVYANVTTLYDRTTLDAASSGQPLARLHLDGVAVRSDGTFYFGGRLEFFRPGTQAQLNSLMFGDVYPSKAAFVSFLVTSANLVLRSDGKTPVSVSATEAFLNYAVFAATRSR